MSSRTDIPARYAIRRLPRTRHARKSRLNVAGEHHDLVLFGGAISSVTAPGVAKGDRSWIRVESARRRETMICRDRRRLGRRQATRR